MGVKGITRPSFLPAVARKAAPVARDCLFAGS